MKTHLFSISFLFLLIPSSLLAEALSTREIPLNYGKSIRLEAPKSWGHKLQYPQGIPFPTIIFKPLKGANQESEFTILITPNWVLESTDNNPENQLSLDTVFNMVKHYSDIALLQAEQDALPLIEVKTDKTLGWYFSATDKAPKPGEFKFISQGSINTAEMSSIFTILSHHDDKQIIQQTISLIIDAKSSKLP